MDGLLRAAVEQSFNAVVITTADLEPPGPRIVYVNPAFVRMTGYAAGELYGRNPRLLQGPRTQPEIIQRLRECLREGRSFQREPRSGGADHPEPWGGQLPGRGFPQAPVAAGGRGPLSRQGERPQPHRMRLRTARFPAAPHPR